MGSAWAITLRYSPMIRTSGNQDHVTLTYVLTLRSSPVVLSLSAWQWFFDRAMRGERSYRSVLYLPSLLGGSVGIAVLWRQLFVREGAVNQIPDAFGIDGPNSIADPDYRL